MTMQLKSLFTKPVDRPIDGVIKADDEASLLMELEEYVVTNEIEKNLGRFLQEYNNYSHINGVWISGFFGSGKSHLLKMLSLVLENREVDGKYAADIFGEKCAHDAILKGEIDKAVRSPSKSILFNIDQKATIISKDEIDALLTVFQSVFDESCGYYREGYIAKLERELDERGQFSKFKEEFQKHSLDNVSWEEGRELANFEADAISRAFAAATGQSDVASQNILDHYSKTYTVSIESFAQQVKSYIDKQEKGFRLTFFVDEVGQYVAENVKLMLNLQTIAETLNTVCKGQAWLVVTAQEALDQVVGNINARQANDFSRVMARFGTRMPLTSQNVAEVIQKRLLKKKQDAEITLGHLYDAEHSNFGTLFDFSDGSVTLRNFKDKNHLIESYPFVPYQYELFRQCIKNLSEHNVFEGRHSSVGERSMLGVFREVAIGIADLEVGQLATFDRMFEGIRTALKSSVQSSIQVAEGNLDDDFAVRVLKALFLVKYYRQFKPTLHNLSVLMLEHFHQDLTALRKKVEEALNRLESETYIQRNGDVYDFLTDEEKDIEEEIKNTEVDLSEISKEVNNIVFQQVIGSTKIRHNTTKTDYSFACKIDNELQGRDYELAINVITPFHDNSENVASLTLSSMSSDELVVILPQNVRFMQDLMLFKRTEKYIKQNQRSTSEEAKARILQEKGSQNAERYKVLKTRIDTMLGEAKLIMRGDELDLREANAKARIERAFQLLVDKVYSNLQMLRNISYSETDVAKYYTDAQDGIMGGEAAPLTEAQQQIFNYVQSQSRQSLRVTLKSIETRFESKPYGWPNYAVLSNTASLCGAGKLEARTDSTLLENDVLIKTFKSNRDHQNIVLDPQEEIPASKIKDLKEFYTEFFTHQPAASDGRGLSKETASEFEKLAAKLENYQQLSDTFSFLEQLVPLQIAFEGYAKKDWTWFVGDFLTSSDDILDQKDDILDPIFTFMDGSQRGIYEQAIKFIKDNQNNFSHAETDNLKKLNAILIDPNCYKNSKMQEAKELLHELRLHIDQALMDARTAATTQLQSLQSDMQNMSDYKNADASRKADADQAFENIQQDIQNQSIIALVQTTVDQFVSIQYPNILSNLMPKDDGGDTNGVDTPTPPKTTFLSVKTISVNKSKSVLETEEDVDGYLSELREALVQQVRDGKRITV